MSFIYFFNFAQIIDSLLIFDLIKQFIENFTELDIELLLTCLTSSGMTLRSSDPLALKEIVKMVFEKAQESKSFFVCSSYCLDGITVETKSKKKEDRNKTEADSSNSKKFSKRVEFMLELIV